MKRSVVWLTAVVALAVGLRLASLRPVVKRSPLATMDRAGVLRWLDSVDGRRADVQRFHFDDRAAVLLTTGPDRAPGKRLVDDDQNGVVDDRSEMGAVGSDDGCLGPADPGYPAANARADSVVISRGGWVPDDGSTGDRRAYRLPVVGWFFGR